MSRCVIDLWPVDVKVCGISSVMPSKSVRNLSEIELSAAELLMISRCLHTLYRDDQWQHEGVRDGAVSPGGHMQGRHSDPLTS